MTTNDWNALYAEIGKLCSREKILDRQDFLIKHKDAFEKLYANYRCDKAYLQQIKILAIKAADNYLQQATDLLNVYQHFEISKDYPPNLCKSFCKEMRKAVYSALNLSKLKTSLLLPKVKDKLNHEGCVAGYCQSCGLFRPKVVINFGASSNHHDTAAHELFHSIQTNLMWLDMLNISHGLKNQEMSRLYLNNDSYYMDGIKRAYHRRTAL